MRKIDYHVEIEKISSFVAEYLESTKRKKYIVGISGGIDSALAAALAVKSIGKEKVIGIMMPYKTSHPDSLADGKMLCEHLDIQQYTYDISPMVDAWFDNHEMDATPLRKGNWMARIRMCILYDLAAKYQALVLGTSNLSEIMTGYFTQHGDSAADIEPLGKLYKSEVKAIAKIMNLPNKIINKAPTADLWENQTDETEMGISYNQLDEILWAIENKADLDTFDKDTVTKVYNLVSQSKFKRVPTPLPEAPCSL